MNSELQSIVEYMHREKGIEREIIFEALEHALMTAARKGYKTPDELEIRIDRKTYDIHAKARLKVVDGLHAAKNEIAFHKARTLLPQVHPGEVVVVEVPPPDFGRIAAQTAKQAIMQRIRSAEKQNIYEKYKDSVGDLLSGSVLRFDRSDVVLDIDGVEAVMPARERVPIEEYQPGDRIRGLVMNVSNKTAGAEIVLSRSHPDFVRRLFEKEVSEIGDGTVEIRAIAREAGFRTKLAVYSRDAKVDPVGACVGMRGQRVKAIVRELSGEKIDIVRWHEDMRTYVTNSLSPAKLKAIELDEVTRSVVVTVDPDQLSLAIGKRGQNARLTAKLTGWRIDIQRDEEQMGFDERVALAIQRLAALKDIGKERAMHLVQAGFLTVEGILAADSADLEVVEGFTPEIAERVHRAAEAAYEKEHGPIEES